MSIHGRWHIPVGAPGLVTKPGGPAFIECPSTSCAPARPLRLWSVNMKIAAARWTFTADLTLTARGCDGVSESMVQVVQFNHCVQGCVMHNCRTREALDHLAVGRAAHMPSCLGELPRVLQQRPHHALLQQTQIFHNVPVLSVTSTFIQPQQRPPRYTFNAHRQLHQLAQNLLRQHMSHDRRLWNIAGDADIPCDVIPTVFGLLFLHVAWSVRNFS